MLLNHFINLEHQLLVLVIEGACSRKRHSVYVAIAEDPARIFHLEALEDDIGADLVNTLPRRSVICSDRPLIALTLIRKIDIRELYLALNLILTERRISIRRLFVKARTAIDFDCRRCVHALITCEETPCFGTGDVRSGIGQGRDDSRHAR